MFLSRSTSHCKNIFSNIQHSNHRYDRRSKEEWIKIRKRLRDWGKDSLLTMFERRQLLREQRHDALKQFHRTVGKLFSDRILEVSALQKTLIAISKTGEQKLPQISDEFFLEPRC